MGLSSASIPSSEETGISPVRLMWSAALRAYHDINVEASIEYVDHKISFSLHIWFAESGEAVSIST